MQKKESLQKNNPLHGITLAALLADLVAYVGWEKMGKQIPINCFLKNPNIKSSLAFLRKTPWARAKVEYMYLYNIKRIEKGKSNDSVDAQ
ncbi:DUF2132 domain-containing protein [Pedobacter sp. SD-b]|uniref:DUF2132 domain-containing protein n=1 Tax=Pedobacter segetis TaxID=2793069 RepID=A0ABS1BGX3_9SPHI|nr:VF530 family DNA-binding protein [Pedobacter segetis]MBK0382110.1 DUF2132 domain-containing protein [Pedobacter segetis]